MEVRVPAHDNDEIDGEPRDWLAHPFTKRVAASCEKDLRLAFDRLVSAAKSSTDPRVVAYASEYAHCLAVSNLLNGKWKGAE
jgi:hypothetical protein